MKQLNEIDLKKLQDYINDLDRKVELKPKTKLNIEKAISKYRERTQIEFEIERQLEIQRQRDCPHIRIEDVDNFSDRMVCTSCGKSF